MRSVGVGAAWLFAAVLLLASTSLGWAQKRVDLSSRDQPILFLADQLTHDETSDIVTARGNVEITQGERTLRADQVSLNRGTDVVTADGNVVLLEPSGDVLFSDHVELTSDFRDGVVLRLRVLMRDRSRFAAVGGRRVGGTRTEMVRGVYSPCESCAKNSDRPLLWQLKAEEIVHDETTKDVSYRDVQLEMFGVPVFYAPFFSHPDPTVERRSGFLAPTFGADSDLGLTLEIPYYWSIAPDEDLTVAPIFMTEELGVLTGGYRRLFRNGKIELEGSIGVLDRGEHEDRVRGHIDAKAGFDLDENWRTNVRIHRASDDTYLRKLEFDNAYSLRSEVLTEYFSERSYASILGFAVQELREDVANDATPVALPELNYNYIGRPRSWGYWTVDANALALFREDGAESRRASLTGGWHLPYSTSGGHLLDVNLSMRGDVYSVDNVRVGGDEKSGVTGRLVPMAVAGWRYPLVSPALGGNVIVEPVASIVLAPEKVNPDRIPNEDSQLFDLTDLNLFEPNRLPGLDRVEGGQRVNYGLNVNWFGADNLRVSGFLGQSVYISRPDDLPPGAGLDDHLSDIVGRFIVQPYDWLDLLYRVRADPETAKVHRQELAFRIGEPWLQLTGEYVTLSSDTENTSLFNSREQLQGVLSSKFTDHWSAFVGTRYDLAAEDPLRHQIGIRYSDECFTFLTTYTKEFTSDREIDEDERIVFRLIFKNLGGIGFGQSLGG